MKEFDTSKIEKIPLGKRRTLRGLSKASGVPTTTLHRKLKLGILRSHSNCIKPALTANNVKERMGFCLSHVSKTLSNGVNVFDDMLNVIHIDEKWFYITKKSSKFYLTADEEEPHRTIKNKNYITRVMFLAAVARPRYDFTTGEVFDGKIGLWTFVYEDTAKRSSVNRPIGAIVTKCIESINVHVNRQQLITNLLPAIVQKWPLGQRNNTIFIQQDNARSHVQPNNTLFLQSVAETGMDIQLVYQPPNSQDLNVLDLGYFNSIQSLQYEIAASNADELIAAVQGSFNELSIKKLDDVFISLQSCMTECIRVNGGNNYKIPHMSKRKLERQGLLPTALTIEINPYKFSY